MGEESSSIDREKLLEAISKKSFGPISLLVPRFKSSKYFEYSSGSKRGPAAILNQNPFFEMASTVRWTSGRTADSSACWSGRT